MSEKKRVLIIDDEPDTLTFFASVLTDNGYAVETAVNGEEGLEKSRSNKPDIITLDITMPEMSGVKFYRLMREEESLKSIPIVIITGISSDFEKFISSRSQVPAPDGYLSKPIDEKDLLDKVRALIG